jgi:hypothetical protein
LATSLGSFPALYGELVAEKDASRPSTSCSGTLSSSPPHVDRFQADVVETELDAYDRRRVRDRPYRRQREPDRFGTSEHYGWAEDKFRQYRVPQLTKRFREARRSSGFNLG